MILLAMVLAASTQAELEAEIDAVLSGRGPLPSLARTQRAAVDALALVSDKEALDWSGRARWQGLLPRLEARFGTDQDLGIRDDGGALRLTEARGLGLQFSARFNLSSLIFSDQELRASRIRLARSEVVAQARERVTKLYFERLKVLLQLRAQPSPGLVLEAARLDGLLRAMTGGRWEVSS